MFAITTIETLLRIDQDGVVRIGKTRVTLDTLLHTFNNGSTREEIVQQYPTMALVDVYAAIAY